MNDEVRMKTSFCHRILIGFAIKAYELCWQAVEKQKNNVLPDSSRTFAKSSKSDFGCL
jgi:hypothetical protein